MTKRSQSSTDFERFALVWWRLFFLMVRFMSFVIQGQSLVLIVTALFGTFDKAIWSIESETFKVSTGLGTFRHIRKYYTLHFYFPFFSLLLDTLWLTSFSMIRLSHCTNCKSRLKASYLPFSKSQMLRL
jgi:hypothetical protein